MNVFLYDRKQKIKFNGSSGVIVTSDCDNQLWCNLKVLATSSPERHGSSDPDLHNVQSFRAVDMRNYKFDGNSTVTFSLADIEQSSIKLEFTQEKMAAKFNEAISKALEPL